ncbi:UNVERIFIED_CONTAM: hypothetical protein Sindi_2865600 [Sesamum indicum]
MNDLGFKILFVTTLRGQSNNGSTSCWRDHLGASKSLSPYSCINFSIEEEESLRGYLQRFSVAALEVPSVPQEVKTSAFSQGLVNGDSSSPNPRSLPWILIASWHGLQTISIWRKPTLQKQGTRRKEKGPQGGWILEKIRNGVPGQETLISEGIPRLHSFECSHHTSIDGSGNQRTTSLTKDGKKKDLLGSKSDKYCRFQNDYGNTMEEY